MIDDWWELLVWSLIIVLVLVAFGTVFGPMEYDKWERKQGKGRDKWFWG